MGNLSFNVDSTGCTFKNIQDLLDEFWSTTPTKVCYKNSDIIENEVEFIIEKALPGFKKENISIAVEDSKLTITGERIADESIKFKIKDTYYGKVNEKYSLSNKMDVDNITSTFIDGILKINIPKLDESKYKKKIEIK